MYITVSSTAELLDPRLLIKVQVWSNFLLARPWKQGPLLWPSPSHWLSGHVLQRARWTSFLIVLSCRLECKRLWSSVSASGLSPTVTRIQVLVPSLWRHQKHRHNLRLSGQRMSAVSVSHSQSFSHHCQPASHVSALNLRVWIFDPECLDHEKLHNAF